ncbi:Crp/Fnr family transcriptional regulator [Actinomadura sp. 21ATH]|uniref:Crp/Fnr family transcriptional regulator n=1 Tax=Actinomadura sp. 21ATH TaxID=1735444 RepID=UPI0035BFCD01
MESGGEWVTGVLATVPLFAVLGEAGIAAAAAAGSSRRHPAGRYVFHQGDPGDRLYVVLDGLVKVVFATEGGAEIVLDTLGPGETFGEIAVLDGAPRSASIVAAAPTRLFSLSRERLLALMHEHPELTDQFLLTLGRLVRRLTERAADTAYLDLGGRLAKVLLQLAGKHAAPGGDDPANGAVIDLRLTQSDLAALVGASRPALNRALHALAARDVIAIEKRTIVLRDIEALRRRGMP